MSASEESIEGELMVPSPLTQIAPKALEIMQRTELEALLDAAQRRPRREIALIRQGILSLATIDEETAETCIYTLKRKDQQGQEKLIQGPSIRLAEIVATEWGNLRAGARTIDNDGHKITAHGMCCDLQNNVMMFAEVSRRITHRDGRPYSEDMQLVTAAAACAIAKRNAIFQVVPLALIRPLFEEIKKVMLGDVSTLGVKREKIFKRFYGWGVGKEKILAVLGKESLESVDFEDITLLIGLGTAIKDKEISIEEAFSVPGDEPEEVPVRMKLRDKLLARRAARQGTAEEKKEA